MTYSPFGAQTYFLGSSISSTATTVLLSSFLEPVTGTPYTMALLNTDIAYGTIAPRTASAEFISFTGITQNSNGTATLTGVVRGLAKKSPFTTDSAYKLPHSGQSQFIISDAPQVFNKYVTLENTETITGKKTFPAGGNANAPVSGTVYAAPTADLEYASKKYVDDIAIAGAPDATTTVKGIVEIATQAEVDAGTATGGTGASIVPTPALIRSRLLSDYKADTGAANAYVITPSPAITAYTVGQIFSFKAVNANTTASTVNVNGLGVKTIKNIKGSDLVANDILAGQIVVVEYDGTNFVMVSPLGNSVSLSGGAYPAGSGAAITGVDQKISIVPTGVALASNTTVQTLWSVSIPGGTLGTSNGIRARTQISAFQVDAGSTVLVRLSYGSTVVATRTVTATGNPQSLTGFIDAYLLANAATNAQTGGFYMTTGRNDFYASASFAGFGFMGANGTAAEDSTGALTLKLEIQFNTSSASNSITTNFTTIDKIA
jgi:hypothetical protein